MSDTTRKNEEGSEATIDDGESPSSGDGESQPRSDGESPSGRVQQVLTKAWEEALQTTAGVEGEVRKRLGYLIERSGLHQGSEEIQRLAHELRRRLCREREQAERRFDEAMRAAVTKVREPVVEELAGLRARAEALGHRIEKQLRRRPAKPAPEEPSSEAETPGS